MVASYLAGNRVQSRMQSRVQSWVQVRSRMQSRVQSWVQVSGGVSRAGLWRWVSKVACGLRVVPGPRVGAHGASPLHHLISQARTARRCLRRVGRSGADGDECGEPQRYRDAAMRRKERWWR